jgi:hypothetical protein
MRVLLLSLLWFALAGEAPARAQAPPAADTPAATVLPAPPVTAREGAVEPDRQPRRPAPPAPDAAFFLWLLGLSAVLATVRVQFGREAREWARALGNLNLAQQWIRNREYAWSGLSAGLFVVFAGGLGTWCWLTLRRFGLSAPDLPPGPSGTSLLLPACVVAVTAVVFLRDAVRRLVGIVFRAEEPLGQFGFQITLLNAVAGIGLLPLLFVQAYASPWAASAAWWISAIGLAGLFAWRGFRGLQVGEGPFRQSRFSVLVYICTLEIAPAAAAIRYLTNWFTGA